MNQYLFAVYALALIGSCTADIDLPNLDDLAKQLPGGANPPNMDEALNILKQKCLKNSDIDAFDAVVAAKDSLQTCIESLIDTKALTEEIEQAKPKGELDVVFRKYCNKTPLLMDCVNHFTTTLEPCLDQKERDNKKIVQNVTETIASFICFKEGDRIALFIAEGGPECISSKQTAIEECANNTMAKYIPGTTPSLESLPELLLGEEECDDILKLQECIVRHLEECDEPTPGNLVESMFKFVRAITPCGNQSAPGMTAGMNSYNGASQSSFLMFTSILLALNALILM